MFYINPPKLLSHIFQGTIWHIPETEKILYLTFDDGPVPEVTPWVLKQLSQYQAQATFFAVGHNAEKYPELIQDIRAAGHQIGNHTFHHKNGWKTANHYYYKNILLADRLLQSNLFRPPYGKLTWQQSRLLNNHFAIVMWTLLTRDFDIQMPPQQCLALAKQYSRPGAIVLFHDSIKAWRNMSYTLPRLLDFLTSQGYQLRALDERAIKKARK